MPSGTAWLYAFNAANPHADQGLQPLPIIPRAAILKTKKPQNGLRFSYPKTSQILYAQAHPINIAGKVEAKNAKAKTTKKKQVINNHGLP